MLGILIGGRFCAYTCITWNFLIRKQQNLHVKENDQHLVQLLPNKLVTPFITVLLVSINVFGIERPFFNALGLWLNPTSSLKIPVLYQEARRTFDLGFTQ